MITVKVVDNLAASAGTDEGVHRLVLVEEHHDAAGHLIGVVTSDNAPARCRVVWFTDSRQEQKPGVIELICAKNDEIRRLENLAALRVDVGDTGGALTLCIEIDAHYIRLGAQFKIRFFQ